MYIKCTHHFSITNVPHKRAVMFRYTPNHSTSATLSAINCVYTRTCTCRLKHQGHAVTMLQTKCIMYINVFQKGAIKFELRSLAM